MTSSALCTAFAKYPATALPSRARALPSRDRKEAVGQSPESTK